MVATTASSLLTVVFRDLSAECQITLEARRIVDEKANQAFRTIVSNFSAGLVHLCKLRVIDYIYEFSASNYQTQKKLSKDLIKRNLQGAVRTLQRTAELQLMGRKKHAQYRVGGTLHAQRRSYRADGTICECDSQGQSTTCT